VDKGFSGGVGVKLFEPGPGIRPGLSKKTDKVFGIQGRFPVVVGRVAKRAIRFVGQLSSHILSISRIDFSSSDASTAAMPQTISILTPKYQ